MGHLAVGRPHSPIVRHPKEGAGVIGNITIKGCPRAVRHGTQPAVVCIISKGDGWGSDSGVVVGDTTYCVVAVVVVLGHLKLFIDPLAHAADGVLVEIGHLGAVRILLAFDASLYVVPPCGGPAHRVGQALEGATFAPLKQGRPIERVGALRHLPDTVVFEGRLPSCAVPNQRVIQPRIDELIKGSIRESDLREAIEGIVIKRQGVSTFIGLGPDPADRIVSEVVVSDPGNGPSTEVR